MEEIKEEEGFQKVDVTKFKGSLLEINNPKDLNEEERDNLLVDNMVLPEGIYHKFSVSGNPNFALVIRSMDTDACIAGLKAENILKTTKNENEEEVMLLNLDVFLENMFDWHENLVSDPEGKYAGYKYILHAALEEVDIYLVFLKGILYRTFVEYMHSYLYKNLAAVEELSGLVDMLLKKEN